MPTSGGGGHGGFSGGGFGGGGGFRGGGYRRGPRMGGFWLFGPRLYYGGGCLSWFFGPIIMLGVAVILIPSTETVPHAVLLETAVTV